MVTIFIIFAALLIGCSNGNPSVKFESLSDSLTKDPNNSWILVILNYESKSGASDGTGLDYWGNSINKPLSIEQAILYFHKYYLPRVKSYPIDVQARLGDYIYNTGRSPEDLLLYATGKISLNQLNSKNHYTALWNQFKSVIYKNLGDDSFLSTLDSAKDRVYQTTKMIDGKPNPAYLKTWKPRVWMWSKQKIISKHMSIPDK